MRTSFRHQPEAQSLILPTNYQPADYPISRGRALRAMWCLGLMGSR